MDWSRLSADITLQFYLQLVLRLQSHVLTATPGLAGGVPELRFGTGSGLQNQYSLAALRHAIITNTLEIRLGPIIGPFPFTSIQLMGNINTDSLNCEFHGTETGFPDPKQMAI
jgi:hypothetical protein